MLRNVSLVSIYIGVLLVGGPRPGPSSAGTGGEPQVAGGHSPAGSPSVCHVAVDGDVFRWVPGPWEY